LPQKAYKKANAPTDEFLMEIGSLDGLIAIAQELGKPVFDIDVGSDTTFKGVIAENYDKKISDVRRCFEIGAKKFIALTSEF
jgi:hypothetical protein